jgi:hypothetical protein
MKNNFIKEQIRVSQNLLALIKSEKYFDMFVGNKTIQTFDDSDVKNKSLTRIFHYRDIISGKDLLELKKLNERGAGIYMAINETDGKGRCEKNVTKVRAVFADLDGSPLDPALTFNPTLVVESSDGRFHCYWFTDDTPLTAFTAMQKNISRILNGDNKVIDLPRVLRVPGFYHKKKEPFLTSIRGGVGTIFSYKSLVQMFPPEPVKKWSGKKYQTEQPINKSDVFRGQYGTVQGERNQHIFRRACGMFKKGKDMNYIQNEIMKEAMACNPPLPESEAMQALNSARKYTR